MGNCLEIPPPPPKLQDTSQNKPEYIFNRTPSITSGPFRSRPNYYSAYQPYPVTSGAPPAVPYDPFIGQPYSYPVDKSPLFSEDELVSGEHYIYTMDAAPGLTPPYSEYGNYSNNGDVAMTDSRHKKRITRKERRSQNGEIPDKNSNSLITNANISSTIITTFPDPQDDVIKRGHEIIVSSGTPSTQSGVISTVTSGAIRISTTTDKHASTVLDRSSSADRTISENQNIVIQTQVSSAPVAKRGSTYVTYIEDDPPTLEEIVEETITTEANTILAEENIYHGKEQTEELNNTVEIDDKVVQLFIDEPFSKTPIIKKTTSNFVSSDWMTRVGSTHHMSVRQFDVVICHDAADADLMWRINKELQAVGFTVAVSSASGGNAWDGFLDSTTFSRAIVDAKVMVVLLSQHSVKNKHLKDQVSLAHITETSIYPVSLGCSVDILSGMDIGLKLQLGSYAWTGLAEGENSSSNLAILVRIVKEELHVMNNYEIIDEDFGEVSSWAQRRQRVIQQRQISLGGHVTAVQYWDRCYTSWVHSIAWERFYKELRREYRELLNSTVPKSCTPYLVDNLKKELAVASDGLVYKVHFVEFCSELGKDLDVWERLRSVARDTQAIRDVFDVESTVRMVAVENVGKFGSQRVIRALRELLTDQDANIRAVATKSLSRYALNGDSVTLTSLMAALDDKDRFVREAACSAMGHLRAPEAVDKLTFMWRNDVIREVRVAAAEALREIGVKDFKRASRELSHDNRNLADVKL